MRTAFGILVESAEIVTHPCEGILVTGPAIGAPEPGQFVTVRGAFSTPSRSQVQALVQFHRTPLASRFGIVLPRSDIVPHTLRGGVIYEEGALFRVFGAYTNTPHIREAARCVLTQGVSSGLVRVQKGIIDAFIIGGGLAEGASLWAELQQIECSDGNTITRDKLHSPMGEAWLVPAIAMYASGATTMVVAPPCGPATPNFSLLSWDTSEVEAEVGLQQSSGIVQVSVRGSLPRLPRGLIAVANTDKRNQYAD